MRRIAKARSAVGLAVGLALVSAACATSSASGAFRGASLTGAGSTFAQPVYAGWAQGFQKVESQAKVNYQPIGSGGGVQAFASKTVDFGATDVPLQPADVTTLKGTAYIEFPTALGAVAVLYHANGVPNGLKLDAATVADIFLGTVKTWNAPEITALNPGVSLPPTAISIVHRADESGTTAVFTSWLSDGSPTWKVKVGSDKAVQWPVGQGANGSSGVAAAVSQTDGAIGYASQDYAVTSGLSSAALKAPDGTFVSPTVQAITAAGGGLTFPITADTNILNSTAPGAYPIASTTYVVIYQAQTSQDKAQTLVDFWHWALTKGQAQLTQLNYAPLPSSVAQGSLQELAKITVNGKAVTPSAGT
ncbi:MAG TPA: phosphate ABC transporter substrate-binding protein PstS [Actinomycetota bacterium]|nr:phosphate ABC transporter substrate-binding protein PstS [Actinomycetota bacterium]